MRASVGKKTQAVGKHQQVHRRERRDSGDQIQQHGPDHVERAKQALRRKEPVGDQANEERGNHARKRCGSEHRSRLGPGEMKRLRQIGANDDVPRSPNDVIEEHHQAEAWLDGSGHQRRV
jgi:hypothetical protein